jgi:hypothetical protein
VIHDSSDAFEWLRDTFSEPEIVAPDQPSVSTRPDFAAWPDSQEFKKLFLNQARRLDRLENLRKEIESATEAELPQLGA